MSDDLQGAALAISLALGDSQEGIRKSRPLSWAKCVAKSHLGWQRIGEKKWVEILEIGKRSRLFERTLDGGVAEVVEEPQPEEPQPEEPEEFQSGEGLAFGSPGMRVIPVTQEVYRSSGHPSQLFPNLGKITDIHPGDSCAFFVDELWYDLGIVARLAQGYLELEKSNKDSDKPPLVPFEDVYEVIRYIGEEEVSEEEFLLMRDILLPVECRRNPDGTRKGLHQMRPEVGDWVRQHSGARVITPPTKAAKPKEVIEPEVIEPEVIEPEPVEEKKTRKGRRRKGAEPAFNIMDIISAPGDGKPRS